MLLSLIAMKVLSLNAGSNSLKFEIVEADTKPAAPDEFRFGHTLVSGSYDNVGKSDGTFTLFDGKRFTHRESKQIADYAAAAGMLLDWLEQGGAAEKGIAGLGAIDRVGHRVVHGGHLFHSAVRIDDEVIGKIESLKELAPLHNVGALSVIRAVGARLASSTAMIAVFDTVFHRTIPDVAALYPLPPDLAEKHHLRRYGFHGISHRYLMIRYGQITQRDLDQVNLVTLHLEGGSSAAAIRAGKSIDTSMGFTPLEGLMMGTRSGDIDPAIVPFLMRKEGMDEDQIENFLNKKCGLLGVSGVSADTRELRGQMENPRVALAIDMFCYRVRKYVGGYIAALQGADAVIFGGGIGENTAMVRARICEGLECIGLRLDLKSNEDANDKETLISAADSRVQAWVIPTQEALMVAYEAAHLPL